MSRVRFSIILVMVVMALSACSTLSQKRQSTWYIVVNFDRAVPNKETAVKQTAAVIESRLNALGISSAEVTSEGEGLRVSLPSVPDRERLKKIITEDGRLELVAVMGALNPAPVQTFATREEAEGFLKNEANPIGRVLPYPDSDQPGTTSHTKWLVMESTPIVDGAELRTATAIANPSNEAQYYILFSLKPAGAEKFGTWTSKHINHYLAVVFDDEVKSVAYIRSQINDQGSITANFTKQSAEDLALVLRSGALPARVRIIAEGDN